MANRELLEWKDGGPLSLGRSELGLNGRLEEARRVIVCASEQRVEGSGEEDAGGVSEAVNKGRCSGDEVLESGNKVFEVEGEVGL